MASRVKDVCLQSLLFTVLLAHMACRFLAVQAVGSGWNEQHEPFGELVLHSVHSALSGTVLVMVRRTHVKLLQESHFFYSYR